MPFDADEKKPLTPGGVSGKVGELQHRMRLLMGTNVMGTNVMGTNVMGTNVMGTNVMGVNAAGSV
ncbi:hypothetical protein CJU94_04465 [Paraburkholderia aromaticivorans]|uniref:Uncharacterized protein n=1 Tax=Paraburkholderia aromaticivorans TaxID=2026199 RepID=A0A248VEM5_9BURK|nr:hypothetical protein CJU94_04465 [Paraburkholderia aromaticivorans]